MPMYLMQTTETMQRHDGRAVALDNKESNDTRVSQRVEAPITAAPSQDIEGLALAYCAHRHVIPPAPSAVREETLLACMKALGLASYSNIVHSDKLYLQAWDYYTSALKLVNTALRCPESAVKDTTLLSVFFLSCCEFTARTSLTQFLEGWATHVRGLCALICLRGQDQVSSIEGRYLFLLACSFILRDHVRMHTPIPAQICEILQKIVQSDNRWRPLLLSLKIANLTAATMLRSMSDPFAIIAEARAIDEQLVAAYSNAPPGWDFEIFQWPNKEIKPDLPNYIYVYRTSAAAMMWNSVRSARIACHSLVMDTLARHCSSFASAELKIHVDLSQAVILQMQMNILASVPHALSMAGENPLEVVARLSDEPNSTGAAWPMTVFIPNRDLQTAKLPILALTRGYALTFQLASAAAANGAGPVRNTFCKALRYMGTRMGFAVASLFADALQGA